jgi:hypothetical protein
MTDGGSRRMEALSGVECYRLLATQQVGRLGVDVGRYPLRARRGRHGHPPRRVAGRVTRGHPGPRTAAMAAG